MSKSDDFTPYFNIRGNNCKTKIYIKRVIRIFQKDSRDLQVAAISNKKIKC